MLTEIVSYLSVLINYKISEIKSFIKIEFVISHVIFSNKPSQLMITTILDKAFIKEVFLQFFMYDIICGT